MKFNHIAFNINTVDEISSFYHDILGFHLEYQFELPAAMSYSIFGINQNIPGYFCKNGTIALELFVFPENTNKGLAHVCLEIPDRNELINHCISKGYPIKKIQRDNKPALLFIWDKSGNCFEIKEAESLL